MSSAQRYLCAEDIYLQRQEHLKPAVYTRKLDIVADEGLVKAGEAGVRDACTIGLVKNKGYCNEVRVVVTIGKLRVCSCVAVSINRGLSCIKYAIRAADTIPVKINPCVIGHKTDGIKDLKFKVNIPGQELEPGLNACPQSETCIPIIEEDVHRRPLRPWTKVNSCFDLYRGKGPDIDIAARTDGNQVINAVKFRDAAHETFKCCMITVDGDILINILSQFEMYTEDIPLHPDVEEVAVGIKIKPEFVHDETDQLLDIIIGIEQRPLYTVNGIVNLNEEAQQLPRGLVYNRDYRIHRSFIVRRVGIC